MEIVYEVCDTCGKKHRMMLKRNGMIFGDRQCFLDFCNKLWIQWEEEEFEARGAHLKKVIQDVTEDGLRQDKSNLLFKGK